MSWFVGPSRRADLSSSCSSCSAMAALVMTSVGIYGLVSASVAERTREIGIRSALGASPGGIVGLVAAAGAPVVAAGLVAGVAAALAATQYLKSSLYGVSPGGRANLCHVRRHSRRRCPRRPARADAAGAAGRSGRRAPSGVRARLAHPDRHLTLAAVVPREVGNGDERTAPRPETTVTPFSRSGRNAERSGASRGISISSACPPLSIASNAYTSGPRWSATLARIVFERRRARRGAAPASAE